MSKCVRVVHRSLALLILAGIFVAAVAGCNPPAKSSQAQENPLQPVQKPDSPPAAAAVEKSSEPKPDVPPAAAVTEPPVQKPDVASPVAAKESSTQKSDGVAPAATTKEPPEPKPEGAAPAASVKEPPGVVAKIGEYEITKDELIQRLLMEVRPRSEEYTAPQKLPTAEAVLLDVIAEKAVMIEGHKLGGLNDPILQAFVERQKRQNLGRMVVMDYVRKNLSVSDAEIDQAMKSDPNLTRERASALAQQTKGRALLQEFYKQLLEKFHFKPVTENFAKASEIHERLLNKPAKPRKEPWILNSQAREEVTKEEKGIVLTTYDGGQVTVQDWIETLCEMAPPHRPKDLNTPEGVQQLLNRTLGGVMLVAEAKARGLDKDPEYVREMRNLEDQQILYKMQSDKVKDIPEPNDAQIKAFYDKNQDGFAEGPFLKVDQIWCKDLAAAQEVKKKLDGGADFRSMKDTYSLQKDVQPYNIYPGGEGPFWADLWKSEPNQVVGPVKGFHEAGLAWRVVKVLEKIPAKARPYDQVRDTVKWTILGERRKAILDAYGQELRGKYTYELYADRIQGIDPLDPALYEQMKQ